MISDPDRYLEAFADAGASMMSVHVEVLPHLHRTIAAIKALGVQAGVVLNPSTPVGAIEEVAARRGLRAGDVGQPRLRRPGASSRAASTRFAACARCSIGPAVAAPIEVDGGVDLDHRQGRRGRGRRDSRGRQRDLRHAATRAADLAALTTGGGSVTAGPAAPIQPRAPRPCVRVRYAETDRMGVVYYANYLVWFEVGRTDWLRETGWTYRAMEDEGLSLPVIEAHCEYKLSAAYDDELEIRTTGRRVSAVRLAFDYEIVRRADAAVVATGHTVHATLDRSGRPVRLPARVKELLA